MKKIVLASSLLLVALFSVVARSWSAQDAAGLTAEIKQARDDADPEKIKQLAALRTRDAMQGLLDCYGAMSSIYMRLEIVRALPTFDGVSDAEQKAEEKLM